MALVNVTEYCSIVSRLVYESPRWLYMVNRHQKADEISRAVSKFNKSKVPGDISVEKQVGLKDNEQAC